MNTLFKCFFSRILLFSLVPLYYNNNLYLPELLYLLDKVEYLFLTHIYSYQDTFVDRVWDILDMVGNRLVWDNFVWDNFVFGFVVVLNN